MISGTAGATKNSLGRAGIPGLPPPYWRDRVGLTALDVSHRLRGMIVSVAGGRDEAIRTLAGSNTVAGLAATLT